MDPQRFDAFTKLLATAATRRRTLALLGAAAIAGLAGPGRGRAAAPACDVGTCNRNA